MDWHLDRLLDWLHALQAQLAVTPSHVILGWVLFDGFGWAIRHVPPALLAFGVIWLLWRGLLYAFSRVAPGRIVGWKTVHEPPDWPTPARDIHYPIVEITTHDGATRQITLTEPFLEPVWSRPQPNISYVLFPVFFAEHGARGFSGYPTGLIIAGLLMTAMNRCGFGSYS